ncbi:MAG: right-handed parallel beta-helix repeat-containing protein [Pirellulales bacterium]
MSIAKRIHRGPIWAAAVAALVLIQPAAPVRAGDAVVPGELKVDPATLHCLAFRWLIQGDDNANAAVTVRFRKQGQPDWRPAQNMLRVHGEVADQEFGAFTCGNLFAGSVLNLQPDTPYEVAFELSDPDGGKERKTVAVRTRAEPRAFIGGRRLHVYPAGYRGKKEEPAFATPAEAVRTVAPGDQILLHAGVYTGQQAWHKSGTPAKPVVYRAAGDGEAILDGQGTDGNIIDVQGVIHDVFIEGLVIRNGNTAIKANGADRLVVRRCRMENVRSGIITHTPTSGWYVADNVITGRDKTWYPRKERDAFTGIIVLGLGHVVCHNRVSKFWDCITISSAGPPKAPLAPHTMAVDMYDNDLSEASDDCIETDYGCYNVRVWENRIRNCHVGISSQPFYGGPCYIFRNAVYNATAMGLKLHNQPAGLVICQNTLVTAGQAFQSDERWQNATLRNNLFLGRKGYAVETGSPHPKTTLDYNGYRHTDDAARFIKWFDGKNWARYATLAEFARGAGHERHGVMVDFDIFQRAAVPAEGETYPVDAVDFRLRPNAPAVDAGQALPNINDDYAGRAPDLGCLELGRPTPQYGPRG